MMKRLTLAGFAALFALGSLVPLCASADPRTDAAAVQAAVNQILVRATISQTLQNTLNGQGSTIGNQQSVMQLNVQNGLSSQNLSVQQILLEQRLNLIELQMRGLQAKPANAPAAKPATKKPNKTFHQ